MRRGIKLVMSAATLVVVGVAARAGAQPATTAVSSVQVEQPGPSSHRSAARTAPASRPSPTVHASAHPSTPAPTPKSTPKSTPTPTSVIVAGGVAQTEYGPVQVQISVRSGRITSARALAQPSGDGRTDAINSYAVPQLVQETVAAQSARIDTVSGATFTSEGYRQSLQSALDAAHQAGAR
ncbi:FMN-binding protein [Kribbella sp. NPDC055071]